MLNDHDRTLANGRWTIPDNAFPATGRSVSVNPDTRDYNEPVTGEHPRPFIPDHKLHYPTTRRVPWRVG